MGARFEWRDVHLNPLSIISKGGEGRLASLSRRGERRVIGSVRINAPYELLNRSAD